MAQKVLRTDVFGPLYIPTEHHMRKTIGIRNIPAMCSGRRVNPYSPNALPLHHVDICKIVFVSSTCSLQTSQESCRLGVWSIAQCVAA